MEKVVITVKKHKRKENTTASYSRRSRRGGRRGVEKGK